jgi:hypothetical protein
LVAFLGSGNSHQALIAVLLGLIDLDHTATEVPDLIDLGTTLSDDGTDHVIGNVNLLSQWLTRHNTSNGCGRGRGAACLSGLRCAVWSRLMGASSCIRGMGGSSIMQSRLSHRCGSRLTVKVRDPISACSSAIGVGMVSLEMFWMAILTTSGLWDIRDNLHTARHCTSRATAASGISRGCRTSKALSELLDEGYGDVVGSDVDRIGNAEDYK